MKLLLLNFFWTHGTYSETQKYATTVIHTLSELFAIEKKISEKFEEWGYFAPQNFIQNMESMVTVHKIKCFLLRCQVVHGLIDNFLFCLGVCTQHWPYLIPPKYISSLISRVLFQNITSIIFHFFELITKYIYRFYNFRL